MKELLAEIAKHMVDNPDQVSAKEIDGANTIVFERSLAKQDLGNMPWKRDVLDLIRN